MGIFNRISAAFHALVRPTVDLNDGELLEWLGIDPEKPKAINEATYFTCLRMLSETMGKMPLKFYQRTGSGRIRAEPNQAARLLMYRPNHVMTPAVFQTTIEYNCNHYGNAYVWIQTKLSRKGKYGGEFEITGFWPMQSEYVEVLMDDAGIFGDAGYIYYRYSDPKTGKSHIFHEDSVLHFKTWCTIDGVMGKPVRDILKDMVEGAGEAQAYLNKTYKSGLSASAVLQYTGELDKARRTALQNEYNSLLTGAKNAGKVVAVPLGMQLQPIKMSMAEAQFAELRKYSALQIAAAFGIKPNHLNDYEKSSYANSESQQLAFLVDTMLYRLSIWEQEINYKCLTKEEQKKGFFFKFNEKVLLRVDAKTQMDTLRIGVNNGLITPNEGRAELDRASMEGGDILMCNGNYIPITAVREKSGEGGDTGGKN